MKWKTDIATQRCPDCDAPLTAVDINISEGVALCPSCGALNRLSAVRISARSVAEILASRPSGCAIESLDREVRITATTRSVGGFLVTLAMMLFWNSLTGMFVAVAAAGIYTNVVGPLPNWFPMFAVENGMIKMNDGVMTLGQALGLCVFLIPFVLIGIAFFCVTLLNLIGRVEIVFAESAAHVATGFRWIAWKRRFDPQRVIAVTMNDSTTKVDGEARPQIELTADRSIKFGTMLAKERLQWLWAVLNELCIRRSGESAEVPSLPWLSQRR
jgi:hypothetical protein